MGPIKLVMAGIRIGSVNIFHYQVTDSIHGESLITTQ